MNEQDDSSINHKIPAFYFNKKSPQWIWFCTHKCQHGLCARLSQTRHHYRSRFNYHLHERHNTVQWTYVQQHIAHHLFCATHTCAISDLSESFWIETSLSSLYACKWCHGWTTATASSQFSARLIYKLKPSEHLTKSWKICTGWWSRNVSITNCMPVHMRLHKPRTFTCLICWLLVLDCAHRAVVTMSFQAKVLRKSIATWIRNKLPWWTLIHYKIMPLSNVC